MTLTEIAEKINTKYHNDYSDNMWSNNITAAYYSDVGSNTLLITVGESWTNYFYHRNTVDANHYWGLNYANRVGADWLNLASPGFSNHWMLENLLFIHTDLIKTKYQKIQIIVCLTEIGRELPDFKVFKYDFYNELRPRLVNKESVSYVIDYQVDKLVEKMKQVIALGTDIIFGSNFSNVMDYLKKDTQLNPYLLNRDWIDLIGDQSSALPPKCEFIFFETLEKHKNFLLNKQLFDLDSAWVNDWSLQMMDKISNMMYWLKQAPHINPDSYRHPDSRGREIWIEYLQTQINL